MWGQPKRGVGVQGRGHEERIHEWEGGVCHEGSVQTGHVEAPHKKAACMETQSPCMVTRCPHAGVAQRRTSEAEQDEEGVSKGQGWQQRWEIDYRGE